MRAVFELVSAFYAHGSWVFAMSRGRSQLPARNKPPSAVRRASLARGMRSCVPLKFIFFSFLFCFFCLASILELFCEGVHSASYLKGGRGRRFQKE